MDQSKALHYQAGEQDTGKKWIGDGKSPIFSKTLSFGALPSTTTKTLAHGLTAGTASGNMAIANFARVVEINATDPNAGPPALSISELNVNITDASIIGDNISVTSDADLSVYDQTYITIEYCKVP